MPGKTLTALGWDWRENGAILSVRVDGDWFRIFLPLHTIRIEFGKRLAAVGCPLCPAVGDPPTVAGLFSGISRAFKKATRAVKKTVPKSIRRGASRLARKARGYARNIARRAKQIASNPRQLAMAAMSPHFLLHSNKLAKDAARLLAAKSNIPAVKQAAQGTLAITSSQENLAGVRNTMHEIQAGEHAQKMLSRGIRRPAAMAQIRRAAEQRQAVSQIANAARAGDPLAQNWMGALGQFAGF